MRYRLFLTVAGLVAAFGWAPAALAQSNELSMLVGASTPSASVYVGSLASVNSGVSASFQVDVARRIRATASGALYLELPVARVLKASVDVGVNHVNATQSQLFFTPGVRYVFAPRARIAPYVVGGFGVGWFDAANVKVPVLFR